MYRLFWFVLSSGAAGHCTPIPILLEGIAAFAPPKGLIIMASAKEPEASRVDVERHRRALLAAAAEELSSNPDSSMADVAQAASLTRATLYRHFSNRQTLLKAIQEEALARATQTLIECRLDEGSALEALRRVITALGKHGMRFRIILLRAPEHNARFLAQREKAFTPLLEVVKRGQDAGEVREDLSPEWILTAMTSLLTAAVRAAPATKQTDQDLSDMVFRTLVDGVSVRERKRI